jgi:hypothetical protein
MENSNLKTKCVIGKVRASYVHLFEPYKVDLDDTNPKYSVTLLIPKNDTDIIEKIKTCIKGAYTVGLSQTWHNKKPKEWWNPLRDGDEVYPDKPEYADCYFVKAACKTKPGVCKKTGVNVIDGKKRNILTPITDEDEMYSGCWIYASVNFFAFDKRGTQGISCGLDNVLKAEDGEMLGGRTSAESDFGDMDIPDDNGDDIFGEAPDTNCPY